MCIRDRSWIWDKYFLFTDGGHGPYNVVYFFAELFPVTSVCRLAPNSDAPYPTELAVNLRLTWHTMEFLMSFLLLRHVVLCCSAVLIISQQSTSTYDSELLTQVSSLHCIKISVHLRATRSVTAVICRVTTI